MVTQSGSVCVSSLHTPAVFVSLDWGIGLSPTSRNIMDTIDDDRQTDKPESLALSSPPKVFNEAMMDGK